MLFCPPFLWLYGPVGFPNGEKWTSYHSLTDIKEINQQTMYHTEGFITISLLDIRFPFVAEGFAFTILFVHLKLNRFYCVSFKLYLELNSEVDKYILSHNSLCHLCENLFQFFMRTFPLFATPRMVILTTLSSRNTRQVASNPLPRFGLYWP
jgi:hypothetical protein